MRSKDVRRLSDDENYVLFFFFSFLPSSDTKILLSFSSRVFVHYHQLLLLFSVLFPISFSRLYDSNDNKTDIISNRQRQEMKGEK
jgi:hypothetical protein